MLKTNVFGKKQLAGGGIALGIMLLSAGMALAGPKGAVGDIYVADALNDRIVQIDSKTGEVVGDFAVDGVKLPFEARFGRNGNLFVANGLANTITEHDGNTGDLIRTFISGLNRPAGLRFQKNRNLLVSEQSSGTILEYDNAGNFIRVFASGLRAQTVALDFGPDGNLYVSNISNDSVQRFAPDGTDLGIFASGGSLEQPEAHVFGPNGNLFVVSIASNTVVEFNGNTGALIGDFINTNLFSPVGMAVGPDGNFWVASQSGNDVSEFDGTTGAFIRQVTGFNQPQGVTVKPPPTDCLTITVSTLTAGQKATWDITGATAGSRLAVVYGLADGETIVNDKLGFCATFGIRGVKQNRLVGMATADGSGNASVAKKIPAGAGGLTVLTQAAEQGTCPDECVSNLDSQIVQ